MSDTQAIIVIPIYTTRLDSRERASLQQCFDVLKSYSRCFVKPQSLDIEPLMHDYPADRIVSFPDDYFKDIAAYNRLMMSPVFYESFVQWDYMLIFQTDAWIFSDRLAEWCSKGYDYIGAPWIPKTKYDKLYYRIFTACKRFYCRISGASDYSRIYYHVGNGGLSLRRPRIFAQIAREMAPAISQYLAHPGTDFYNEDIFWSLEVNRDRQHLKIPHWKEALQFSFDKNPAVCYALNGNKLPFGCHGWYKKNMLPFWEQHIQTLRNDT